MLGEWLDRLRWLGRLFLLLFVLGAAAFLSAITAMRFAIEGSVVATPNLLDHSYENAQAVLRGKKLEVVVADHAYSVEPIDNVVRQSPPPGTPVKVGQRVQVVLSLGPQMADVPALVDESLPAARLALLNSGLQLGEVSYLYASGQPAGLVLQQDPLPGKAALASPGVSLLVSLGPRSPAYIMPNWTGAAASQVQQRLAAAGLPPATVTPATEPGAALGSVVGQTPAPGARLDRGTPVVLGIASAAVPPPSAGGPAKPRKAGPELHAPYAKMPSRSE